MSQGRKLMQIYIYNCQGRKLGRKQGSNPRNMCTYIHAPRPQAGARSRPQARPLPITQGRKQSPSNQTLHPLCEGWGAIPPIKITQIQYIL